jgi:hypothetical protein
MRVIRNREVNWGDRTHITGGEQKTLAWVSVEFSEPMVVYATCSLQGPSDGIACIASIEWGHGGASVRQDYPIVQRLRVPLAASMIKVHGSLRDAAGKPAPPTVSADVSLVIAPGSDGETIRNTRWLHGTGASGVLTEVPSRVVRLEGYNAGAATTWVMFFDGAPKPGDTPVAARPVPPARAFAIPRNDTQAFRVGVSWAASTTPLVLTPDPGASLRVDAECLL